MVEKSRKLVSFSKTGESRLGGVATVVRRGTDDVEPRRVRLETGVLAEAKRYRLEPLITEWLLDLRVQGRGEKTLGWYKDKLDGFRRQTGAETLADLTAFQLKQHLAIEQGRGLADTTVHGSYQCVRAFGAWASRENYPVEPALLRVRAPKVSQKEMETYTTAQLETIFSAAKAGWQQMAIQILLGTGMRVSELCALTLQDVEDDGDVVTLKVQRGKGAKFRRVPVSSRLRRELVRYINRLRPESETDQLLVLTSGRPLLVVTVIDLFRKIRHQVGFAVHAHKFRHTFATEYLRRGGEIERLRRILGHTSYVMVMRYVHLDKGDLCRDFDLRSPF